jgi:hypothetical protein
MTPPAKRAGQAIAARLRWENETQKAHKKLVNHLVCLFVMCALTAIILHDLVAVFPLSSMLLQEVVDDIGRL